MYLPPLQNLSWYPIDVSTFSTWSDASWPGWVVGRACSTRVRQKFRGAARRGHDVVGRVLARVGGWSDAGPPSRGGWVVGRDGYLKYRVHVGKQTGPGRVYICMFPLSLTASWGLAAAPLLLLQRWRRISLRHRACTAFDFYAACAGRVLAGKFQLLHAQWCSFSLAIRSPIHVRTAKIHRACFPCSDISVRTYFDGVSFIISHFPSLRPRASNHALCNGP